MVFRLEEYKDQNFVMVCAGQKEVDEFSEILHRDGRTWASGDLYIEKHHYHDLIDGVLAGCIFAFNVGKRVIAARGIEDLERGCRLTVLRWSDFTNEPPQTITYDELFS